MNYKRSRPLKGFSHFALFSCALLGFAFAVPSARAQSASDPPATPAASPAQGPSAQAPAKPAKPKHVITNDDLPSSSSGAADKNGAYLPGPSRFLDCDAACEQAARNYLGYDSENEGEWREQIVKARKDLPADNEWRGLLNTGIAQVQYYCNFLAQQSQKTAPSNNSYNAKVQRAQNTEYFEYTERNLRQSMEGTANRMEQRMREVAVLSRVRAALMYVQAERIWNQGCDAEGSR